MNDYLDINARIGWRGLTKKEYTSTGAIFLSVHSLNYGKNVVFNDVNYIPVERYEESPEIQLKVNDILLCKDGAGIGKIGIIKKLPNIATVNSSLLVIQALTVVAMSFSGLHLGLHGKLKTTEKTQKKQLLFTVTA